MAKGRGPVEMETDDGVTHPAKNPCFRATEAAAVTETMAKRPSALEERRMVREAVRKRPAMTLAMRCAAVIEVVSEC